MIIRPTDPRPNNKPIKKQPDLLAQYLEEASAGLGRELTKKELEDYKTMYEAFGSVGSVQYGNDEND